MIASPNLASGMVKLQINKRADLPFEVSIVNATGKIVQRSVIKNAVSGNLNLSLKGLPSGLYVVVVEQGDKRAITKLIVE